MSACVALDLQPNARSEKGERGRERESSRECYCTLYLFLHFVKDKIEELVVSLEYASHCSCIAVISGDEKKEQTHPHARR